MRDQGDFGKGVKRFAYNRVNERTDEEWNTFSVAKPIKEVKELGELSDTWSIRKNVSVGGTPLDRQGSTVLSPPSGTGFYSRHGQHNPLKKTDATQSSPSIGQTRNSFALSQQRSGYSYSNQSDPISGPSTSLLPKLPSPTGTRFGGSSQQYQRRAEETGTGKPIGLPKPGQFSTGSKYQGSHNKTSRTDNQYSGF